MMCRGRFAPGLRGRHSYFERPYIRANGNMARPAPAGIKITNPTIGHNRTKVPADQGCSTVQRHVGYTEPNAVAKNYHSSICDSNR